MVVDSLTRDGYEPIIFFDASARHRLKDLLLDVEKIAKRLEVPLDSVVVTPAKTEADEFILGYARSHKLPVVSNDAFKDRSSIASSLILVKGVIVQGSVQLSFERS